MQQGQDIQGHGAAPRDVAPPAVPATTGAPDEARRDAVARVGGELPSELPSEELWRAAMQAALAAAHEAAALRRELTRGLRAETGDALPLRSDPPRSDAVRSAA